MLIAKILRRMKYIIVSRYSLVASSVGSILSTWYAHLCMRLRLVRRHIEFIFYFKKNTSFLADNRFTATWADRWMCLEDDTASLMFDPHYVYHLAWATRKLAELRPDRHTDISSLLYFAVQLSAFIPTDFYDYRPPRIQLSSLATGKADLCALPFASDSLASLSCMHVVEHIGLGRYGEPLDPKGDLVAMQELSRVLKPGGSLLFAVPMAENPSLRYNSCRIYSYSQIVEAFPALTLREFSLVRLIDDYAEFVENASPEALAGQKYACGCMRFEKPL